MFVIFMLLLAGSAFVSNIPVESGVKIGVNTVIVLIFIAIIVFSIL